MTMKIELDLPETLVADIPEVVDHDSTRRAEMEEYSRRSMLIQMACFFAAIAPCLLLMVSCGNGGNQELAASEPEQTAIPAGSELTIFTWEEYIDPEVLIAFEKSTGFKVNYEGYDDLDHMEALLKSRPGRFDVVITDSLALQRMMDLRLLAKLDHSRLANFANVDKRFADQSFDPENSHSVPYLWGSRLIVYRKDKVGELEPTWPSLFEANANAKGKIGLLNSPETLYSTMFYLGIDPAEATVGDVNRAEEVITDLVKKGARLLSNSHIRYELESGELWIATTYSGDALMIAEENENISYLIPREGAELWVDNFAIARDTDNSDLAHLFLDFMMEGKNAAANANFTGFASPNTAASPHIDPELLADSAINPPSEVFDRSRLIGGPSAELEVALNLAWKRIIQAIQRKEAD